MKTGKIDLPLHCGTTPRCLFEKMKELAGEITEFIVFEFGEKEFLLRVSDPLWFQAFACTLGFDWHSSGTTTTTIGALKVALKEKDIGIHVAGGKGKSSLNTLNEIDHTDLNEQKKEKLRKASRLAAKVDNGCIQDGYTLYHHAVIFDEDGRWAIVQQGMNEKNSLARRYHWRETEDFVNNPPNEIIGKKEEEVLNTVSKKAEEIRKTSVDVVNDGLYKMPERHEIRRADLSKRDLEIFRRLYEFQPKNYEELLLFRGVGPKKIRALALLSNLLYGCELDWNDPVKYSFSHGGKDGVPYPVDKPTLAHSISFLKDAIKGAKSGGKEKIYALKNLNKFITSQIYLL